MINWYAWDTADELKFIATLGTHSLHSKECTHQEWVKRYQQALPLRKDWRGIDLAAVQAAVKKELA